MRRISLVMSLVIVVLTSLVQPHLAAAQTDAGAQAVYFHNQDTISTIATDFSTTGAPMGR